jgi:hypothetical protein
MIFSIAKDTYLAGWTKWFFYPALRLFYYQQMQVGIPKKGPLQTLLYRSWPPGSPRCKGWPTRCAI